jgi:hypothetical protein
MTPAKTGNTFKQVIKDIFSMPVWLKQIIFLELKDEFDRSGVKNYLGNMTKDNCFQLYIPKLTYSGKKEVEKRVKALSKEVYSILEGAFQDMSILEIAVSNNWNFHECSTHFLAAVDNELVSAPSSSLVRGTALYMSGRIRLGEYFVKIDKISMAQLNEALKKQKDIEEALGDRPGLADIFIEMGFLTKEDTEGILYLKKDCKKSYEPAIAKELERLNTD